MLYIIDTESTGFVEPKATEIAYIHLTDRLVARREFYSRFNPGKPISLGATATTHIFDEDVANEPHIDTFEFPADCRYLVAHNVDYDWGVLGKPDVKRICTLALSRSLYPDIDSHTQTAMMYHLFGKKAVPWVRDAHNAKCDVDNCLMLFRILVDDLIDKGMIPKEYTLEDLYRASEEARIPVKVPFGKHKGELIKDVPYGYVSWYMGQAEKDPYFVEALRRAGKIK